jgi:uroporphyrin-III C-methyltransferase / precorrin-2 dehydrogenase / sirohydrochlorin ferrochelatase
MSPRKPVAEQPGRIAPLAVLPVFFRLAGKRVVLAGASDGARWKAELLVACGADLHVFAPEFPSELRDLAQNPPAGTLTLHARGWLPEDLDGAVLAVADIEDAAEAGRFVAAAKGAGAAYNVIDKPAFCGFQFGGIVNRSPLVIGISTDGAAPVFGQAIRAKIEAILPAGLRAWAEAARDWRPAVQLRKPAYAARRAFWELFTRRALAEPDRAPSAEDRAALLATLDEGGAPRLAGRVSLVGAGPGDPELLTLKAMRVLQAADVILHDDLVSPEVLELARREATRIRVGKKGHGPSCRQAEICDLMVALAREGKHVVRLKSGDPGIFGRATEEIDACRAAGVPVMIVPGITAAQGAAAALGVSLTERSVARRLQFLTGHGQDGALPRDIVWAAIADPAATTVLYMPRKSLAAFRVKALAAGLPAAMPAVAIMNATRADERRLVSTLATLPEKLAAWTDSGPVLVMIGQVLAGQVLAGQIPVEAAEAA